MSLSTRKNAKAPLISISAIVGDLPSDNSTVENVEDDASESCTAKDAEEIVAEERTKDEDSRADTGANVSPVAEEPPATTEEPPEEAQVVPVWEPDARQGDQSATAQAVPRQKRDNNNEVCPWEDE